MIELRFLKELVLVNKASESKEFDICHYCFLDKGFKLQPNVCNGFHDVLMMSINLIDIIWNTDGVDYLCIINWISTSDAVNVLQNTDLTKKKEEL